MAQNDRTTANYMLHLTRVKTEMARQKREGRPTDYEIDYLSSYMPETWLSHWCDDADDCKCVGCAKGAGQFGAIGVTKERWQRAVDEVRARQSFDPRRKRFFES